MMRNWNGRGLKIVRELYRLLLLDQCSEVDPLKEHSVGERRGERTPHCNLYSPSSHSLTN